MPIGRPVELRHQPRVGLLSGCLQEGDDVLFGEAFERQSLPLLRGVDELRPHRCVGQLDISKRAHDEQRLIAHRRREKLEKVNGRYIGDVQVLQYDDERKPLRRIGEHVAHRIHQLETCLVRRELRGLGCRLRLDRRPRLFEVASGGDPISNSTSTLSCCFEFSSASPDGSPEASWSLPSS